MKKSLLDEIRALQSSRRDRCEKPISYDAAGGGHVEITFPVNPWQVLGLPLTLNNGLIKQTFREKINQSSRQKRAMISMAEHILTSTTNRYKDEEGNMVSIWELDEFVLAAAGYTQKLASRIDCRKSILDDVDEHGRTLLYLACKSGFYDTCKLLLEKGASVNKTQRYGSTPLHVAAYYGHTLVVGLLLEHGAATNIKNREGSTALDEGRTDEIKSLIQAASKDRISSLTRQLKEKGLVTRLQPVVYRGKIIGKELVRDPRSLDPSTRAQWDNITRTWETVWHGTHYENLLSILKNGFLSPGSNGIEVREGHIPLEKELFGVKNWAAAIFVSPSIQYAGHAAYSERVLSESRQWCVLVKALCKPESYKAYDPTTFPKYDQPMDGEPEQPEYRVPVTDKDKQVLFRIESCRSVVVKSLMFISLNFLENEEISFEEASEIFA